MNKVIDLNAKRNASLDFMKFFFSVMIVLFHSCWCIDVSITRVVGGGYLAVEFFFICSGLFMAASASKANDEISLGVQTKSFLVKKVKGLMPNFLVAWILAFIIRHIGAENAVIIEHAINSFWSLFLLQYTGIRTYSPIGPTWYISAMLLAMLLLYPLLVKYKDTFYYVIAPIVFLFLMGYTWQEWETLKSPGIWNGFMLHGTMRAIMEISLGCLCYKVGTFIKGVKFTQLSRVILSLLEINGYLLATIFMVTDRISKREWILVILLAVSITISFSKCGAIKNIMPSLSGWLGEYSYSLFLAHYTWAMTLKTFLPGLELKEMVMVYVVISAITGLFVMYVSKGISALWKKNKNKIKSLFIEQ